ncbi:hypothetical protein [Sulfurivermis fontis]|uniref:hypothetical protein n=1 Tax=Sulfurivermis fontis TaxID=1972068 RepID=UPI000FD9ADF3|nr:hypothetical protein [Sulfurivermis fontis]
MSFPTITTAIPLRRYQYGEFVVTVLGDIESPDAVRYRYVLAVAQEGNPRPGLFVSAERGTDGVCDLRVSMADGSQVLDSSPAFCDLELFVKEALQIVSTLLNLSDEMPHRLM